MTTTPITADHVHRWLDAWNSHDIEQIKALFTDDMVMYQPQNPKPLNKENTLNYFAGLFGTYPDIHFASDGFLIQGLEVASWEIVTATMTGPFHDPATGHTIPPTGKAFEILGAMRLKYSPDGLINSVRIYWDRQSLAQQLGLVGPTLPADALVLQPGGELTTLITMFTTTPNQLDELADKVVAGVRGRSSKNPGFSHGAVLKAVGGTTIANISQWTGGFDQLTANHQANEADADYQQQIATIAKMGTMVPQAYEVIFVTKS